MSAGTPEAHRGLAGVVADTTAVSVIDQETGVLLYRGYPVPGLAASCSFEEVAYLIWYGELPSTEQLEAFTAAERSERDVPRDLTDALAKLPLTCDPMDLLRTAVSYLGALDPVDEHGEEHSRHADADEAADLRRSIRLWAQLPTIVAAEQRRRRGQAPIAPDPALSFVENFFHMCFGSVPGPEVLRCFEISLVLYAEHGFNASTFTARVITSTLSDLYSAVTGAIGALKGPLHGGANEAVMAIFNTLPGPEAVPGWLEATLAEGGKVMGFGHRVYKNHDPRATINTALAEVAARSDEGRRLMAIYDRLEQAMLDSKGLYPNLDYATGPVYHLTGFDTPTFTPIFVMSRVTGWTAHIIEQKAHNALIRPLSAYVGVGRRPVPERPPRGE